jgi:hypothetical protein
MSHESKVNELFDELNLVAHERWTTEDKWEQIRLLAVVGRQLILNEMLTNAIRHRVLLNKRYEQEEQ